MDAQQKACEATLVFGIGLLLAGALGFQTMILMCSCCLCLSTAALAVLIAMRRKGGDADEAEL